MTYNEFPLTEEECQRRATELNLQLETLMTTSDYYTREQFEKEINSVLTKLMRLLHHQFMGIYDFGEKNKE